MKIDTGPTKKFLQKASIKIKKKFSDGSKVKMKKTFTHPRNSVKGGAGSIRTNQNPMPGRMNANIGFDY